MGEARKEGFVESMLSRRIDHEVDVIEIEVSETCRVQRERERRIRFCRLVREFWNGRLTGSERKGDQIGCNLFEPNQFDCWQSLQDLLDSPDTFLVVQRVTVQSERGSRVTDGSDFVAVCDSVD